jgi:hypothetical protein
MQSPECGTAGVRPPGSGFAVPFTTIATEREMPEFMVVIALVDVAILALYIRNSIRGY